MPVDTWFTTAERWFETNVVDATELATFGFVMLCVLLVALVVLMFSLLGSLLKTLRNASHSGPTESKKLRARDARDSITRTKAAASRSAVGSPCRWSLTSAHVWLQTVSVGDASR